ncbi:membrane hypothetical protein [Vibrio chagasii]|nr:membrane hypothetical protein [Vibrio chagasii]
MDIIISIMLFLIPLAVIVFVFYDYWVLLPEDSRLKALMWNIFASGLSINALLFAEAIFKGYSLQYATTFLAACPFAVYGGFMLVGVLDDRKLDVD